MTNPVERKLATTNVSILPAFTRHVLAELNSSSFVLFLERLTGISGLIPDPHYVGGGLHQIERGGFLKVHADFNRHPILRVDRRLNLLIYLNPGWRDEYGGHFELWDAGMKRCVKRVLPVINRCVVFTTGERSFHGHPDPLTCPEGTTRRSLALYYYTAAATGGDAGAADHTTLFQRRPGEQLERSTSFRVRGVMREVLPPILVNAVWRRRERGKIRRASAAGRREAGG